MDVSKEQKRIDDMIFKIARLEDENEELKKKVAALENRIKDIEVRHDREDTYVLEQSER